MSIVFTQDNKESSYLLQNQDNTKLTKEFSKIKSSKISNKNYDSLQQSLLDQKQQESQIELIHNYIMDKIESEFNENDQIDNVQQQQVVQKIEELYENDQIFMTENQQKDLENYKSHKSKAHKTTMHEGIQTYTVYKSRYLQAILFAFGQLVTCLLYQATSPIANKLYKIYDSTPTEINLAMLLYLLGHPVFTFPASMLIEKKGSQFALMLGCVFSLLCAGLRLFINEVSFPVVLLNITAALAGIGRPFIVNCQSVVAFNWFSPEQRNLILSLFSFNVMFASTLGGIIPGLVFNSYKLDDDDENYTEGKDLTFKLIIIELAMTVFFSLPTIILSRNKPKTPPSFSATVQKKIDFKQGMKDLMTNKNFVLNLILYFIMFGTFKALGVVGAFLMKGLTALEIALVSVSPIPSGLIMTVIGGIIIKKYKCYKLLIIIGFFACSGSMMLYYSIVVLEDFWYDCLGQFIFGISGVFLTPIMIEYGVEVTFPTSDALSVGLLFAGGQLGGVLIGNVASLIVDDGSGNRIFHGMLFMSINLAIGGFIAFFLKQDLRRLKAEQEQQKLVQDKQIQKIGFSKVEQKSQLILLKNRSTLS